MASSLILAPCHRLVHVASVARNHARLLRCGFHLTNDVSRAERRVRAFVPFNLKRSQTLLGCSHVLRDDGYGILQLHDLCNVLHRQRFAFVDAL